MREFRGVFFPDFISLVFVVTCLSVCAMEKISKIIFLFVIYELEIFCVQF